MRKKNEAKKEREKKKLQSPLTRTAHIPRRSPSLRRRRANFASDLYEKRALSVSYVDSRANTLAYRPYIGFNDLDGETEAIFINRDLYSPRLRLLTQRMQKERQRRKRQRGRGGEGEKGRIKSRRRRSAKRAGRGGRREAKWNIRVGIIQISSGRG